MFGVLPQRRLHGDDCHKDDQSIDDQIIDDQIIDDQIIDDQIIDDQIIDDQSIDDQIIYIMKSFYVLLINFILSWPSTNCNNLILFSPVMNLSGKPINNKL